MGVNRNLEKALGFQDAIITFATSNKSFKFSKLFAVAHVIYSLPKLVIWKDSYLQLVFDTILPHECFQFESNPLQQKGFIQDSYEGEQLSPKCLAKFEFDLICVK